MLADQIHPSAPTVSLRSDRPHIYRARHAIGQSSLDIVTWFVGVINCAAMLVDIPLSEPWRIIHDLPSSRHQWSKAERPSGKLSYNLNMLVTWDLLGKLGKWQELEIGIILLNCNELCSEVLKV